MAVFLVFFNYFLWSSTFSLGKVALACSPPLFLIAVRMILAGIVIVGAALAFKWGTARITVKQWGLLALLGLTSVYLSNAFELWGLQYLTAAKTCFIYSLTPFISAILSYFQFKERLTPRKIGGLLIGFLGFVPVFLHQSGGEEFLGGLFIFSWAELAVIAATVTSVYGWVLLRRLGKDEGVSPVFANGASMVIGGLIALGHSFIAENWLPTPVTNWSGFTQGILAIILVSNLICYNLYGWLLKRFTATFLSFAGLISPLFAAFYGWYLHGESVPPQFFLSVAILLCGLWFVYSEELRLGYFGTKKPKLATDAA